MIARRFLPWALGAAVVSMPLVGEAQQGSRVPIVGILLYDSPEPAFAVFREKFRELGYEEGRNFGLEVRSADAKPERLAGLAAELVRMKADVIIPVTVAPTRAAIDATKRIPIVMASVDPLMQLLKEAVPTVNRIAVMRNPDGNSVKGGECNVQETERAARQTGVEVRFFLLRAADNPAPVFAELTDWRADALLHMPSGAASWVEAMIAFAAERRLPTLVVSRDAVEAGGLMSYVPDRPEMYRRVAVHVDKILKGAKPADIPVELPTKYEFVINLKTASALGITIPPGVLIRADAVIE
jgi:putative ABC transport system substrate-binding protein